MSRKASLDSEHNTDFLSNLVHFIFPYQASLCCLSLYEYCETEQKIATKCH